MQRYEDESKTDWREAKADCADEPAYLKALLTQGQDPAKVDKLTEVQKHLTDVKSVQNNFRRSNFQFIALLC